MSATETPPVLWEPTQEFKDRTVLARYMRWLASEKGIEHSDYHSLWRWSTEQLEAFWASIWEFFDIRGDSGYGTVLGHPDMPGAEWFPGASLSYAEHMFRGKDDAAAAIHHASELRELQTMTWAELRAMTAGIAAALRVRGVEPGDRVVAYMPNIPETVAAFFACASIGAVWSSCSPDFGARSVVDRFAQIEPKVLLAVDGYRYNGKDFDRRDVVAGIAEQIGGGVQVVEFGYLNGEGWPEDFRGGGPLEFMALPFDHPLWVLYSSGTTGLPKAIVQSQGGILLEHIKKLSLHLDAQYGDRVFWFTTTGWMMWNFLIGVLLTPAQIVLYDGSPGHPDLGVLWDLAEQTRDDLLRHQRGLHRVMHEGRRGAGRRTRPVQAAQRGLHRLAAAAGGVPVGLRPRGR